MKNLRQIRINNKKYWNNFYKNESFLKESSFAKFTWKFLKKKFNLNLADIGCGNGRDSIFFLKKGISVTGFDINKIAIAKNIKKYGKYFIKKDFCKKISDKYKFDIIYVRFFIHAITYKMQLKLFHNIKKISHKKTLFFFEYRTINDPLINKGIKISKYERFTNHYRRFIDTNEFSIFLKKKKFKIIYKKTSKKFSIFKKDKPVITRIVSRNA